MWLKARWSSSSHLARAPRLHSRLQAAMKSWAPASMNSSASNSNSTDNSTSNSYSDRNRYGNRNRNRNRSAPGFAHRSLQAAMRSWALLFISMVCCCFIRSCLCLYYVFQRAPYQEPPIHKHVLLLFYALIPIM